MNITELTQSEKWKNFMGYVYGWGASVVLMGALFKIQHWPYAGVMLTIGMGTEVLIFFFSAFEPPHEEPDWSLVYPELIGLESQEKSITQLDGLEKLQTLLNEINVPPETFANLSQGLNKLSHTAEKLADLSDISAVTEDYVKNINSASENINKFSSNYIRSTENLSESANKLAQNFSESGSAILESYRKLNDSLHKDFEKLSKNSGDYNQQLKSMNDNISSLNTVYELQLNYTNEQINKTQGMHHNMNEIIENLSTSLENVRLYRKETEEVNKSVQALNTIYGNMLSAMDTTNNKN